MGRGALTRTARPPQDRPKFRSFSPSPATIFILSSLSWGLLVEFWYRGCPDRDPLGCPLIPRQDGIRDKAPTLWLLQLLHACACVCAHGHNWTCFHKRTPSVKCTLTWILTDLACTVTHCTSSVVPELRVQRLRTVQIVTFASRPATNLLHMNGSFSTISAAVHGLTSRTFCTCSLELLEWARLLAFDTSAFTARS